MINTFYSLFSLLLVVAPGVQSSALKTRTVVQTPSPPSFVVGSIIGQPAQTRTFDFTISEIPGAPDGVQRSMLVVNGQYPGA